MKDLPLIIGSHVSMSGKDMMEGSVREALSYGANTFMLYTGAPQNTRRKPVSELHIAQAQRLMEENRISSFVVHAPYLINLANTVKPETYEASVRFLIEEARRTRLMGSSLLILHPGSHVGAGAKEGIKSIVRGLNEVLSQSSDVCIALETMSGKGSEIGRSFEELAAIYEGVSLNHRLRVCFDTCHTHDAGYDIAGNPDGVLAQFDRVLGLDQIAVFHINDSKRPPRRYRGGKNRVRTAQLPGPSPRIFPYSPHPGNALVSGSRPSGKDPAALPEGNRLVSRRTAVRTVKTGLYSQSFQNFSTRPATVAEVTTSNRSHSLGKRRW